MRNMDLEALMGRDRWGEGMYDVGESWQGTRAKFAPYEKPSE